MSIAAEIAQVGLRIGLTRGMGADAADSVAKVVTENASPDDAEMHKVAERMGTYVDERKRKVHDRCICGLGWTAVDSQLYRMDLR
jgi:hypothetical protein